MRNAPPPMPDPEPVRLATRAEIVAAAYGLDRAKRIERIVEHADHVVAFIDGRVDVFRFDGTDIVDSWQL